MDARTDSRPGWSGLLERARRRRPGLRELTLRDVLVLTLPPLLLALWLLGSAVLDYHRIRQFDDWWANATSVRRFAWQRAKALLLQPRASLLRERLAPEDPYQPSLRLRVDRATWEELGGNVAAHWGTWMDAEVLDGGDLQRVEVRFRGDGSAHWTSEKKSLTVQARRGEQVGGYRELALSVKDVLPQYVVNALAPELDLLAPDTRLLPVYVNEGFYGLHRFVEPVDESFLRRHVRLPGNVFRGDTAERGEYFKGVARELFLNPAIWDRVASNDRPGSIGAAGLEAFLRDLNGGDARVRERLWSWLDRAEIERLLALLLVAGDPYHMSGVHNQLWYEDPAAGLLHPIVWDLRLLDLRQPPRDTELNRFWRVALRDPRVLQGALRTVHARLDGLLARARKLAEDAERRFASELAYDRLRAGAVPPVGDAASALALLEGNARVLRGWIDDARAAALVAEMPGGVHGVDVVVSGRAAVALAALRLPGASAPELWLDSDLDGALGESDRQVALARGGEGAWRPAQPLELAPGCAGAGTEIAPEPLAYRLFVRAPGAAGLALELRNALTGAAVEPAALEPGAALHQGRGWHPWTEPERSARTIRLAGHVQLERDLVVEPGETLAIEPGTTIDLAPDVSILCKGRLEAIGLPDRPIALRAADPHRPWGTLALQGPGADGSLLRHVRLERGGGALLERVEYTGMVCVHAARGVRFEDCAFARNQRCDDLLHVDVADASVLRCLFEDANSDAIDYDMSTGEIRACLIEGSGNDGIDLMTCGPRVVACRIAGSGDKGISVGEASFPLVFATRIEDCVRGTEVKDRSRPLFLHSEIEGCGTGVLQHVKNWRYAGPGWAAFAAARVAGNEQDYVALDDAFVTLAAAELPVLGASSSPAAAALLALEHGLEVSADGPGLPLGWREVEPARVLASHDFAPDLAHPSDGWVFDGAGVQRLVKRRPGLIAHLRRGQGTIGARVDWDLREAAGAPLLALELASEGLAALAIEAVSPDGEPFERELPLADSPATYAWRVVELPRRRFEGLKLHLRGASGAPGRLALRSWRLLELPPRAAAEVQR